MKTLIIVLLALTGATFNLFAGILAGPFTNSANGHVYFVLTTTNWAAAEREAISMGGHLATINDAAEDQWVFTNFAHYASVAIGIGLNDLAVKGTYCWASGEESTYRNWNVGEPNNTNGGEDVCGIWVAGTHAGKWNDFVATGQDVFLVETIPGIATFVTMQKAVEIRWATQTTNRYQVQWSSALNGTNWFNFGPAVQGSGSTNSVFDSMQAAGAKFYRVLALNP